MSPVPGMSEQVRAAEQARREELATQREAAQRAAVAKATAESGLDKKRRWRELRYICLALFSRCSLLLIMLS